MKAGFPMRGAGDYESHAIVRPRSAAVVAWALANACRDAGVRDPDDVRDASMHSVEFSWWLPNPRPLRHEHSGRASAYLDAEGALCFLLSEPGDANASVASWEAGEGDTEDAGPRVPLAESVARLKAFLDAGGKLPPKEPPP